MIRATLITDGSSDRVLIPILQWMLGQHSSRRVELRWADLRGLPQPPKELAKRIETAIEHFPCDLLFVHRDAEAQKPAFRYQEIVAAVNVETGCVCVVPVRMSEAWLLHDEVALRTAAGSPSGTQPLGLPPARRWESLPDPKQTLHDALRVASGLKGRRAKDFQPATAAHRLAELVRDWSPLRQLSAFTQLEADTSAAVTKIP